MKERKTRAVLASLQQSGVSDDELNSSMDELERLASTLGLQVVARITQRRRGAGAATVLGAGKLKELARLTGGTGCVPLGATRRLKGAKPAEDVDEAELDAEIDGEFGEADGEPESDLESDALDEA
ncbi:MAG: GTPase HflX, partial [Deltaproteobacteria bacterium]|nr:GTPase HflX [Deltaproteobacteria bacterium]